MNPDTLSLIHEATARRKKTRRETHDEYARTIASIESTKASKRAREIIEDCQSQVY